MLLLKHKKAHREQLMLLGLHRLLTRQSQTIQLTKKSKPQKTLPKIKKTKKFKTKLVVSCKVPKVKQKKFNQPLIKLLTKKKRKVS
jgi:ribosomal protein L17